MKKTLLAAMAMVSLCGYAQLPIEGFESPWSSQWGTPSEWHKFGNGVDWTQSELNNPLQPPYSGSYAAYLAPDDAPLGTTSDWLVTPALMVGANMSLHFYSRLLQEGDQGSIYKLMYSPVSADPTLAESYTELQSWTEMQINPNQLEYTEKVVGIPAVLAGTSVRFAFVMVGGNADGWLVDDVKFIVNCQEPTNLVAYSISTQGAALSWANTAGASSWEIEVLPGDGVPTGVGTIYNGQLPYAATGTTAGASFAQDTSYKYFVRTKCPDGGESNWTGPYYFTVGNCPAPTNVTMTSSMITMLTYSWTPTDATQYDYLITTLNAPAPTAATVPSGIVAAPSVVLAGLDPSQNYKFYVRAVCSNTSVSPWVGPYVDQNPFNNNVLHGKVLFDSNQDGTCGEGDTALSFTEVQVSGNGGTYSVYTNQNGEYNLYNIVDGNYTLELQVVSSLFGTIAPVTQQLIFTEEVNDLYVNHCLGQPLAVNDLEVTLIPVWVARPGFDANYTVMVRNTGSLPIDDVVLNLSFNDDRLNYVSSGFEGVVASTGNLSIPLGDLQPFSAVSELVTFYVMVPPTNNGGEQLEFEASLSAVPNDITPENNEAVLNQVIVNSFDPNDITVHEGAEIYEDQADDYLTYTIRFQNTGTAEAINIRLENTLENQLDWSTFKPIASSHNYEVKRTGNLLKFEYKNIFLPDSTSNQAGSHGFVTYKIKPKAEYGLGDTVYNTAEIYFDFNEAIVTNTASTKVIEEEVAGLNDKAVAIARLYPNPVKDQLFVAVKDGELRSVAVYDINGRLCLSANAGTIDTYTLNSGIYFVKVTTNAGSANYKIIKH